MGREEEGREEKEGNEKKREIYQYEAILFIVSYVAREKYTPKNAGAGRSPRSQPRREKESTNDGTIVYREERRSACFFQQMALCCHVTVQVPSPLSSLLVGGIWGVSERLSSCRHHFQPPWRREL